MTEGTTFTTWENAVLWLRMQPEKAQLVLDAYYDDPLIHSVERYSLSPEWCAISSLLPVNRGSALDIGAGRGIASYALAKKGFRVTSLEPDPSSLVGAAAIRQLAIDTHLPIEVVEDFSESLPFPDSSFDLVFARAVLHHTRDLYVACLEFNRVLKPGGLFIAIREHVISHHNDLPEFLNQHPLHNLYGGENAFLLREYQSAFRSAGFHIQRTIAPFDSPINYAPRSTAELRREISSKLSFGSRLFARLIYTICRNPILWLIVRKFLALVDHRPGRLYSFVAIRAH